MKLRVEGGVKGEAEGGGWGSEGEKGWGVERGSREEVEGGVVWCEEGLREYKVRGRVGGGGSEEGWRKGGIVMRG